MPVQTELSLYARPHCGKPSADLMKTAAPEPLASIATILADTGLRPDELYRLQWEDVNFSVGQNGSLSIRYGKTAAARRTLPLTPRVRFVLENRWELAGKPREGFVWPAPTKSGHVDHSSIKKQHERAFRVLAERAKQQQEPPVTRFVLYTFRHTFLTRLAEAGVDAWTLARIAGWSDISISKRYVHPSENAVLGAMERLPQLQQKQLAQGSGG
jgi:integrase